jgi:hypothetical protein
MKNVLMIIGFIAFLISLGNVVALSLDDYHRNIVKIGAFTFVCAVGGVITLFAQDIKPKISEEEMVEATKAHQRKYLREQMKEWNRELEEQEIEKLARGRY